jgi:hypothetical protein
MSQAHPLLPPFGPLGVAPGPPPEPVVPPPKPGVPPPNPRPASAKGYDPPSYGGNVVGGADGHE